jgi:hypothetical protein
MSILFLFKIYQAVGNNNTVESNQEAPDDTILNVEKSLLLMYITECLIQL